MAQDISKKTVAVLLVLAIVLTVTGTWIALTTEPLGSAERSDSIESGRVSLKINEPPQLSKAGGNLGIVIK